MIGIGLVSLFADFTYEGGRSISGPFLAVLGAGPLLVGAVAGVGEFLGYLVRLFSGRLADRTGGHWALMYAGYALNLLSVPGLALAGGPGALRPSSSSSVWARGSEPPPGTPCSRGRVRRWGTAGFSGCTSFWTSWGPFWGPSGWPGW